MSKEGSYVPPDPKLIRDARSNPKFIRYLYMAESPTTAVYEVRPIRPAIGAENIDGRFEYIVDNVPMRMDKKTGNMVEAEI